MRILRDEELLAVYGPDGPTTAEGIMGAACLNGISIKLEPRVVIGPARVERVAITVVLPGHILEAQQHIPVRDRHDPDEFGALMFMAIMRMLHEAETNPLLTKPICEQDAM